MNTETNHKAKRQADKALNHFDDSRRAQRQAKERNVGPNTRIRTGNDRVGYSVVRLRDGAIVGGTGAPVKK